MGFGVSSIDFADAGCLFIPARPLLQPFLQWQIHSPSIGVPVVCWENGVRVAESGPAEWLSPEITHIVEAAK